VTTRTCKWRECHRPLITQRADAEFCGPDCKNAWHNEERRKQGTSAKRFKSQESGVGSRGGTVRDLDEARGLQEEQKEKARWTLIVREHIARTLLETGYFHCDDLDALGIPPAHCNIKGSQIGSFRSRGLMEKTGQERKVSHVAANGRRAPIYRISAKGRRELSKMLVGVGVPGGLLDRPSRANSHPGEKQAVGVGAGVPSPQGTEENHCAPASASVDPGGSRAGGRGEPGNEWPSAAVKAPGPASPDQLFELGPDRPRSAWTDPETAEAA
jgi:hypothetical protein